MGELTQKQRDQVIKALENPRFLWRTISGISRETGLDPETVRKVISEAQDEVMQSSIPSADGQELFSTRSHYRSKASVWQRLRGAILNQAD